MRRPFSTYIILSIATAIFLVALSVPLFLFVRIHSALSYVARVKGDLQQEGYMEIQNRSTKQLALTTQQERSALATLSVLKTEVAGFISGVEATARAAGVSLDIGSVSIANSETNQNVQTLTVQTTAEGTQAGVVQFLQLLETMPQATMVSSVSLERREKNWALIAVVRVPIRI